MRKNLIFVKTLTYHIHFVNRKYNTLYGIIKKNRNTSRMDDKNLKPEELYRHLKELAEKLSINVIEQNFRNTGIPVKSGLCKIKEKKYFIMDKDLPIKKKNMLLADCLGQFPHEDIFILPAIRDLL